MPEFERIPMKEFSIADVTEGSKRVLVRGTVIGCNAESGAVSLDDGTGKIDAFFDNEDVKAELGHYKEGDRVLVVGWSREGGLNGEVLRALKGNLNPELKGKVDRIWGEENV